MAVTTKKTFPATTNGTTTVFSPVSIQLNNQDDLDVYVTLSGGTRVLQLRQSTGSTAQSSHPQVNNTDGLYFPAVSAGTTLYNYTLSSDNNTITFNSALPSGAVVFCERRTRDADSSYTSFASGSTIRATDLNNSSTESNFTAQDARNKALDLEGSIFGGIQPSINGVAQPFVNSSKIIDGSIATVDIADSAITSAKLADGTIVTGDVADGLVTTAKIAADAVTGAKIANDTLDSEHYVAGSIDLEHMSANSVDSDQYVDGSIDHVHLANDAVDGDNIADNSINSEHYVDGSIDTAHIADSQVTTAKIADANVTSAKIASNAVTTDKIADGELTTLAGMQSTTASNLASSTALTATTAELNQLDGITLETTLTSSDTRIPTSKAVNDQILAVTNALGGFVAIANETSFPTANPDPSNGAGTVVSISQISSGTAVSVNNQGTATIANGAGTGNTVTITGFPSTLQNTNLAQNSGLQVQTTTILHRYTFHKQLASADDIQAISATVNSFSNRYRVSATAPTSSLDGGDLWYDTTNSKLMVYSSQNTAWEESSAIGNFFISTISSSSSTGGGSATANGTAYRFTISNAPSDAQQLLVSVDGVIQKPNAGSSQPSEGFVLVGNDIIFGSAPANGASMFVTVIGSTVGIGTPSNNTVTTAILQNGSVTTAKIVDANVTTAKIADANVTTAKIADSNVTTAKIADANVTEVKLASNSVSNSKLTNSSVDENKLAVNAVTTDKITNLNVTTAKIANNAVTAAKMADDSVGADELNTTGSYSSVGGGGGLLKTSSAGSLSWDTTSYQESGANIFLTSGSNYLELGQGNSIKFDSDNTNTYEIKFTAPNTLTKNSFYTLPEDGSNGQFLKTNGSGVLSFGTVSTDLSGDSSPQLGGALDTNEHNISFGDSSGTGNDRLKFGDSDDLSIYHNGTVSQISGANGSNIYIQGDDVAIFNEAGNKTSIWCNSGADVELYYDNAKRFETTSTGADFTCSNGAVIKVGGTSGSIFRSDGNGAGIHFSGDQVLPANGSGAVANNAVDLGTASYRWRNIYTNDLNLSNEGSSNDVDGSWGDWTIQEGESDLFLKNNRSGKKYKFNLTEIS